MTKDWLHYKRKVYSMWGLTIWLTPLLIFGFINMYIFRDLLVVIWGVYLGANTIGKFAEWLKGRGEKK